MQAKMERVEAELIGQDRQDVGESSEIHPPLPGSLPLEVPNIVCRDRGCQLFSHRQQRQFEKATNSQILQIRVFGERWSQVAAERRRSRPRLSKG